MLIKITPDNSQFNKNMIRNSKHQFLVKKPSSAAVKKYLIYNGKPIRVEFIPEEPEKPVNKPVIKIGNFSMNNLKAEKPKDIEQFTVKHNTKKIHPLMVLCVLVLLTIATVVVSSKV